MRISVIVPAYNEEKLLAGTLRHIQDAGAVFARRHWERELIVCDNNSSDATADVARAAGATVVFEPVNQIARARNTGARAATGDWLLFVDADTHPSRELMAVVADCIQSGLWLAGGSTVDMPTAEVTPRLVMRAWNWISRTRRWFAGSFIFCEARAFREVGGFNEQLYVSEEIDLSKRLRPLARRQGKDLVILHRHPVQTSARKLHLYTHWEHWQFIRRAVCSNGRTLKQREGCSLWYDGRR